MSNKTCGCFSCAAERHAVSEASDDLTVKEARCLVGSAETMRYTEAVLQNLCEIPSADLEAAAQHAKDLGYPQAAKLAELTAGFIKNVRALTKELCAESEAAETILNQGHGHPVPASN